MLLAKELAEKATDLVVTHVTGKLAPLLAEIAALKEALSDRLTKAEADANLRDALKAYAPFDVAMFEARLAEIKAAIPEAIKGDPGKDAEPFEPLVGIDPNEKSYPAGTCAVFDNGFWKATEATNGMAGWSCLVEGLKTFDLKPVSEREFVIEATLSSGKTLSSTISVPAMIYRGVYDEEATYEKGDTVTFKGALWHCNETTDTKPGESKLWTLAVKRGGQEAKGA